MKLVKPADLRKDFVRPLLSLAAELEKYCVELEEAYEAEQIPRKDLPLNVTMAQKGMLYLKSLVEFQVKQKVFLLKQGALRYRESAAKNKRDGKK